MVVSPMPQVNEDPRSPQYDKNAHGVSQAFMLYLE
jgi:hypothetical protein